MADTQAASAEIWMMSVFQRILVAIDASAGRFQAVRMATDLALMTGGRVHVLHVLPSTVAYDSLVRLENGSEAYSELDEALAMFREAGVAADGEVVPGLTEEVPDRIAGAAAAFDADLILLSPHHRGAVAAFFNRRVSDAVAHASRVPVLLAPEASETPER